MLTPDFLGVEEEALQTVIGARPDVFNHNIETVRRLHRRMRGAKASYDGALQLLHRAKEIADYPVLTKSGIIVGLGETNDEVVETMRDLRAHGVDVVTIGQYLQPGPEAATIDRWVHPDEFRWFREQGEAIGFGSVFSGPLAYARATARTNSATRPRPAAVPSRTSDGDGSDQRQPLTLPGPQTLLTSRVAQPSCPPPQRRRGRPSGGPSSSQLQRVTAASAARR